MQHHTKIHHHLCMNEVKSAIRMKEDDCMRLKVDLEDFLDNRKKD